MEPPPPPTTRTRSTNNSAIATGTTTVNPVHDLDRNLVNYGSKRYVWYAENRLIEVRLATGDALIASYRYASMSRLIHKETTALAPQGAGETVFHYEGWNLCAEYPAVTKAIGTATIARRTNTWGLDVSGTLQGVGGVGGLLAIHEQAGNGNIVSLFNSSGSTVASYAYDGFGNRLNPAASDIDGSGYAAEQEFGFSTKFRDAETGLYYYGYRYYDPVTGRWPSRDPIEEMGGVNLYGFVRNNAVYQIDHLGHVDVNPQQVPDPVKAPVIWTDQPGSQNPGFTHNTGLAVCICHDIGPKKDTVTCEVTSRTIISLNKKATLKAGETWKGVYGHEQRHAKLFASELRRIIKELEEEADTPGTPELAEK